MKLYDGGRAPNPRRVQIFLKEKGLEIPARQLDLNALEHRTDEIRAKNPFQTVPFLELDDGTVLSETMAICRYLEELHPEPLMFGKTALERATVEMWNRRTEMGFMSRVAFAFRHLHPAAAVLEGEQVADWGLKNQKMAVESMELLDAQLAKTRFIAGEKFSVADITGVVACQFMKPARIEMPEKLGNLRRWYEEASARPSMAV